MPPQLSSRYIRLGALEVDQQRQHVTRGGFRVKVSGKVYQVLIALIEKQGEIVSREELRLRLWPGESSRVNYDANVNTTINKLRQVLGDAHGDPLYIETVPRRGYRLVAEIELADHPAVDPGTSLTDRRNIDPTANAKDRAAPKSGLRITLGLIALILWSILFGAGITHVWLGHFAHGSKLHVNNQ